MSGKIVIAGCSWGCGEWVSDGGNNIKLGHPGLTEYLSDKYSVVNLSRGGASNWQSCFALRNYLNYRVDHDESLTIVVLQTNAHRRIMSNKFDVDYDSILLRSTSLLDYYQSLLDIFYIKLNNLAEEYKVKIHMIGALSDLDLNLLPLYNNLIPCCPSWVSLLTPYHTSNIIPLILDSTILSIAKKHNRFDLIDEATSHSDQHFLKAQELMETEYFGPAYGDFHPSRLGHEVLANYIKNYLDNKS